MLVKQPPLFIFVIRLGFEPFGTLSDVSILMSAIYESHAQGFKINVVTLL